MMQEAAQKGPKMAKKAGRTMKARLFKLVLFLIIAGGVGLVGFAYFGDLSPERQLVRQPVSLDVE